MSDFPNIYSLNAEQNAIKFRCVEQYVSGVETIVNFPLRAILFDPLLL